MANVLDGLLEKIEDAALRSALIAEVARLRDTKQFGLVFERHLPEIARLANHPIRRGTRVQRRADPEGVAGIVTRASGGVATVEWEGAGTEEVPLAELVAVGRFGEPIYPGLKSLARLERGGDKPFHVVVKAENYHALQTLQYTHQERIDVIYIDPPYNLGGDLTYNDRRVAKDDAFRHSKWLSFMDRRLRLARDLLRPAGAIIVAIDDTEQAHLRLLMDQIFGEQNFIACVVWQGGRKNDSRYVSVGHDYMLIYARSEAFLKAEGITWEERRPYYQEIMAAGRRAWEESGGAPEQATDLMKKWIASHPKDHGARLNNRFYEFEAGTGRLYRKDNISWPGGGGPRYDVLHPVTGKPVKIPGSGWRYSSPERMQEMIDVGRIHWGSDHNDYINKKSYLDEVEGMVPSSVFEQKRTGANTAFKQVMGDKRFAFPKDTNILARWLSIVSQDRKDAVVLDFFVGSGSTVQAVMELNAADGGRRQCIGVTNNEVEEKTAKGLAKDGLLPGEEAWEKWGIFEYVTRPRIEAVVAGVRPDGSKHSDGLDENVEFLELTYQDANRVARGRAFAEIAPLLWLMAGANGPRVEEEDAKYAWPPGASYAVLFEPAYVRELLTALGDVAWVEWVFIVTDSSAAYQQAAAELPSHMEPVRLYSTYLHSFAINAGEGR